jgi:hypothetical protein
MLLTQEVRRITPPLYETEGESNPFVTAKFHASWNNWTWYLIELSDNNNDCFGYVCDHEKDFHFFSLSELEALKGPSGQKVERDLRFSPRKLNEVKR